MHEQLRHVLLVRWGRLVTTHPLGTLAVAAALAAAGVTLAVFRLEFKADRSDLVSLEHDWNRRYADYKVRFPRWDDITIAVEGEPDDPEVDRLARDIANNLGRDSRISSAEAGFDAKSTPRIYQTAPREEFDAALRQLSRLRAVAVAANANSALTALLQETASLDESNDAGQSLANLLAPFLKVAGGGQAEFTLPGSDENQWRPFTTKSGRIRLISVQPADITDGVNNRGNLLEWLRAEVGSVVEQSGLSNISWGVTGLQAIEGDETTQSMKDSTRASVLALILITALMAIAFRGIIVPLLAAGSLLVAMGWSFGWVVLSVGHLQILSVVFSVVLLGLGVDFAVHVVARLELLHEEEDELPDAMARVFNGVGPGVITGAVTTAAAFAAISFTDFTGAAELGIISAGGIILCLVGVFSVFPALLAAPGRWKRWIHPRAGGEAAHFRIGLGFVTRRPWMTLALALLSTAGLAWLATFTRYDPNVLKLHPPGVESVVWERRIIEDDQSTAWAALLPVRPERAAHMTSQLSAIDAVSEVAGAGMLFPVDWEARMGAVASAASQDASAIVAPEGAVTLEQILMGLAGALRPREGHAELVTEIEAAVAAGRDVPASQRDEAWRLLNQSFLDQREILKTQVDNTLRVDPVTPENVAAILPAPLRTRWIGNDGSWLLRIQPKATAQPVLHPDRLGPFVRAVHGVAPEVIGPPVQIYESSRLIQRSYILAACYALAAILLVLLIDFHSLWDSLCALSPVVVGFVGMFGIMPVFDVPLNFANMIVMPIILGIGVDAGIHVVHRWRADPEGRPAGLSGGTGRGITITMLTTIIGFACMLIAEHRGIRSLGFTMTVGLSATLVAALTMLPAILTLRTRSPMSQ